MRHGPGSRCGHHDHSACGEAGLGPADGLHRPDAVYGSASAGGSKRSIQTVTPLAARLGMAVDHRFAPGDEHELAAHLRDRGGATLVSWHHESVRRIVDHLGPVTPAPPRTWPEDRFDVVWTFTRSADGWSFDQVPQLLLPDDSPDPITERR